MRAALCFLLAGCTIELPVGHVETQQDAAGAGSTMDADAAPLDAGEPDSGTADSGAMDGGDPTRTLSVGSLPTIMCADSLGGREADFAAIRPADVQLSGGELDYHLFDSSAILSGSLLLAPFGTDRLVLREGVVPEQPAGVFFVAIAIDGGAVGPNDTIVDIAGVYVDTLADPPAGEAGFQYETANADGACFVSFSIMLNAP